MLSDTLLDSSPAREPVLNIRHWLIAAGAAAAAFCAVCFGLPLVEAPASILAAASFLFVLMLAYVYADSQHLRLRTWPWIVLALLLNIAGFIAYLIYTATKTGNWKRATLPIAYVIEVMVIGVMVIVPLVYTQALPKEAWSIVSTLPPPPPPPPRAVVSPQVAVQKVSIEDLEKEPVLIPKTIVKFKHQPITPSGNIVGSVPGGVPGGQSDGLIGSILDMTAAPPPPPQSKPQTVTRIRQGGAVEAARLIYGPKPDYPQLARMARIQGTVRLEALIAADGTIKGLRVISGHPLLVKAAIDAVQQWRYQPTLLNGQSVVVETEIDVNFALGD